MRIEVIRTFVYVFVFLCIVPETFSKVLTKEKNKISRSVSARKLFVVGGQSYTSKDLSPSLRQQNYEIELEYYKKSQQIFYEVLLKEYFSRLLEDKKNKGKTLEQLREQELSVNITDKMLLNWYKENKVRLGGRKFESIKLQIKSLLVQDERLKKRSKLIARLLETQKNKNSMHLTPPVAPEFFINVNSFSSKGSKKAKVTLVEFADYQCPHCKMANLEIKKLLKKYKSTDVRFVYIDFPINHSGISRKVAEGAYCAEKQSKYWEYHNLAFSMQNELTNNSPTKLAEKIGLDKGLFASCLNSKEPAKRVDEGKKEGNRLGVSGTPAVYLNGTRVMEHSLEVLNKKIDKLLGKS